MKHAKSTCPCGKPSIKLSVGLPTCQSCLDIESKMKNHTDHAGLRRKSNVHGTFDEAGSNDFYTLGGMLSHLFTNK